MNTTIDFTYECGLETAHTFIIYGDKNRYIKYLRDLSSKYDNQFLKGVADGLDMIVNGSRPPEVQVLA